MNASKQRGDETRYVWQGKIWLFVPAPSGDIADDKAVSDMGHTVAADELMGAIYRGEALEHVAPTTATTRLAVVPANPYAAAPSRTASTTPAPSASIAKAAPAAPPVMTGQIDTVGRERAQARIDAAKALGVALPSSKADGLFYDLGTLVDEHAWASERKAFEELPTGEAKLPEVAAAIRAEDRQDHTFNAWDLRMSKRTGKLGDPDPLASTERAWLPTKRGFQGFTTRAGIGAIPEHWPTDIKAGAVNDLCRRFQTERPRQLLTGDQDPVVVLRVQKSRGKIFACVSPTYGAFDGDLVLESLLSALPRGSRVNVDYDPDAARGRVEIVTLQEERPVVGEPFRTSFTVGWDDTGGGSIWGDGGLFSARCLNLTRIFTSTGTFRIRHAGDVKKLARRFRCEFERVSKVVTQLSKAYGHAAGEELTNAERIEGTEFLQGVYRSLLQRDLVPVRGRREEVVKGLAIQALADENGAGMTRAGIVNGITRYAHRVNEDAWQRDEIERAAGKILWSPKGVVKLDYLAKDAA